MCRIGWLLEFNIQTDYKQIIESDVFLYMLFSSTPMFFYMEYFIREENMRRKNVT